MFIKGFESANESAAVSQDNSERGLIFDKQTRLYARLDSLPHPEVDVLHHFIVLGNRLERKVSYLE